MQGDRESQIKTFKRLRQVARVANMSDTFIPRMDWDAADPSQALKLFEQKCNLYFSVKDIKKEKQVDHILLFSGEPGLKFYNSWGLTEEEKKDPEVVWNRLQTQIKPKTNFRLAGLVLQKLKQENGESIDDFVARCKLQAYKCNFREEAAFNEFNERVIEQVITGTCHAEVQKELLSKDNTLTLEKVLDVGRTHEASNQHMKQLKSVQAQSGGSEVHYVKKNPARKTCSRCGYEAHLVRQDCPAQGSTCRVCGKPNHWSTVCRLNQETGNSTQNKTGAGRHQHGQSRNLVPAPGQWN